MVALIQIGADVLYRHKNVFDGNKEHDVKVIERLKTLVSVDLLQTCQLVLVLFRQVKVDLHVELFGRIDFVCVLGGNEYSAVEFQGVWIAFPYWAHGERLVFRAIGIHQDGCFYEQCIQELRIQVLFDNILKDYALHRPIVVQIQLIRFQTLNEGFVVFVLFVTNRGVINIISFALDLLVVVALKATFRTWIGDLTLFKSVVINRFFVILGRCWIWVIICDWSLQKIL